ncbi:hypothetical protein GCM10010435_36110 [Winogradskya consettensis]|uniref:DUF1579 domain-containing protein n=1 Tax=Winogradskya consettensis TaxID=113560 RepID=A0A919SAZ1_9ACTN|nr:hypothetical protein [Actinoplanes consettensis]GIM68375.1 hypothetical protein Aco04nite_10420 [Actinoplanes consettensis]
MEHDFDFLHGNWHVHNRRLRERLAACEDWDEFPSTALITPLFGGAANIDEITFGPGEASGLTLRLWDPAASHWSLHWTTSDTGRLFPAITGTFTDGVGTFYGDDTEGGTPVRVRFIWSGITVETARWEQAFSTDDGATWETNWVMELTRA